MQKISRGPSPRNWPVVFVAPDVRAHYENLYWLSLGKAVVHSLQHVVVPVEYNRGFVPPIGNWSKVNVSDLPSASRVPANDYNQSLIGASSRPAMRLEADIVLQRSALKNVVPCRYMQCRNINIGKMFWNGPALPI